MRNKKKRLGVYAGSFDPLTIGHLWMIREGVNLFDRLIVPGPVYRRFLKA